MTLVKIVSLSGLFVKGNAESLLCGAARFFTGFSARGACRRQWIEQFWDSPRRRPQYRYDFKLLLADACPPGQLFL
jgi:hypothetical protein